MNPSSATVSPLRQCRLDDLRMRNLGPKTQSAYVPAVRSLARFLRRRPVRLGRSLAVPAAPGRRQVGSFVQWGNKALSTTALPSPTGPDADESTALDAFAYGAALSLPDSSRPRWVWFASNVAPKPRALDAKGPLAYPSASQQPAYTRSSAALTARRCLRSWSGSVAQHTDNADSRERCSRARNLRRQSRRVESGPGVAAPCASPACRLNTGLHRSQSRTATVVIALGVPLA